MSESSTGTTWRPDPSDPNRERVWLGDTWGSTTRLASGGDDASSPSVAQNPYQSSSLTAAGILGALAAAVGLGGVIVGIMLISSANVAVGLGVLFSALIQAAMLGGLSHVCAVLQEVRATSR
ncbi:MAG TPA: hypothetical protein VFH38_07740 [Jatrophihabitans sp.]|nr:hypothetical protein [Jatrophihabitans sp.]